MSYKYWRGFASGMRNTFVNINGEERIITNTEGGFRVDDGLFQFIWEHICLMYVTTTLRRLQTSMPSLMLKQSFLFEQGINVQPSIFRQGE